MTAPRRKRRERWRGGAQREKKGLGVTAWPCHVNETAFAMKQGCLYSLRFVMGWGGVGGGGGGKWEGGERMRVSGWRMGVRVLFVCVCGCLMPCGCVMVVCHGVLCVSCDGGNACDRAAVSEM